MKRFLLILFFVTGIMRPGYSQKNDNEKIHALKIAFITERLQLTSEEAQKFWPVYNSYDAEIKKVWNSSPQEGDVLKREEKVLEIRKKYSSSFEKVIGKEKANKFFKSEQDFRNVLMKRLRNNNPRSRRFN